MLDSTSYISPPVSPLAWPASLCAGIGGLTGVKNLKRVEIKIVGGSVLARVALIPGNLTRTGLGGQAQTSNMSGGGLGLDLVP